MNKQLYVANLFENVISESWAASLARKYCLSSPDILRRDIQEAAQRYYSVYLPKKFTIAQRRDKYEEINFISHELLVALDSLDSIGVKQLSEYRKVASENGYEQDEPPAGISPRYRLVRLIEDLRDLKDSSRRAHKKLSDHSERYPSKGRSPNAELILLTELIDAYVEARPPIRPNYFELEIGYNSHKNTIAGSGGRFLHEVLGCIGVKREAKWLRINTERAVDYLNELHRLAETTEYRDAASDAESASGSDNGATGPDIDDDSPTPNSRTYTVRSSTA